MIRRTVEVGVALGNIRSNPRMSAAEEQRATAALHAFAEQWGAWIVLGCEVAYPRMRRIWRRVFAGWATVGDRPGSENVISVRTTAVDRAFTRPTLGRQAVRWLSKGRDKVTPTRTTTEYDVTVNGLRIRIVATHLVSWWQRYAKPKAGKTWGLRHAIAMRSVARLERRVEAAHAAGIHLVIIGGDLNALQNVHIADGQVQVLGTAVKAGGNLGKMMQLAACPAPGVSVHVDQRQIGGPVATDHPFRGALMTVTW